MAAAAAGGGDFRRQPLRALRILLARPRDALLLTFAAGNRRLARGAGTALHLGRRLGNRNLAGGRGLSGYQRLRLVDFLVLGGGSPLRAAAGRPAGGTR